MRMHFPPIRRLGAAALLLGLLLSSCSGPFLDSMRTVVSRETAAVGDCSLRYGYGLSPNYAIRFTFTQPIAPDSLQLKGTMAPEAQVRWPDAKTLLISPATEWQVGDDRTIDIRCTDTNGYDCQVDRMFSILDDAIYVSPAGVAWNSGTKTQPLGTVEAAAAMAVEMYPDTEIEIRLAEGVYYPHYTASGQALVLRDRQTWNGGYSADFTTRDPERHPSVIDAREAIGASQAAVSIPSVVHGVTVDGLGIRSPEGDESTCLAIIGSTGVTLSHLALENSSTKGYVLYVSDAQDFALTDSHLLSSFAVTALLFVQTSDGVTLRGNHLEALSSDGSAGIYLGDCTSALVEKNIVRMGLGALNHEETAALWLERSHPVVRNNILDAGSGIRRISIRNVASSPRIVNNTCYAGTNTNDIYEVLVPCLVENLADDAGTDSAPTVINNLLMSGGILSGEFVEGGDPTLEHHNSFSFFSSNFLTGFNFYLLNPYKATNDVRNDLWYWITKPDWKLLSTAPLVLRQQGVDLSSDGFSDDLGGNARPRGAWSRGAWQ